MSIRSIARRLLRGRPSPPAATPDPDHVEYQRWLDRHQPDAAALEAMRSESRGWAWQPLVSVVVGAGRSGSQHTAATVDSVRRQTYEQWELREPHASAPAAGDYLLFVEPGSTLVPHALHTMLAFAAAHRGVDALYPDEDTLSVSGERINPFFKPDWSPDLLRSFDYVGPTMLVRRDAAHTAGGPGHELALRLADSGCSIGHVADVLVSRPALTVQPDERSTVTALSQSLQRRGLEGTITSGRVPGHHETRYVIGGTPLVSVVIPTRDRVDLLRACIRSIEARTTYPSYEIVIVDNGSTDAETFAYLRATQHRVVTHPGAFNYSRIVNHGVAETHGEHVLLLNNDVEVIRPEWMEAMLEHSRRPEVGAVGARLLYPDGRPQHEGIGVGLYSLAESVRCGGYFGLGLTTRNVSAVTGACMMLRRALYDEIGGLDDALAVAYNDVDMCHRLRARGYWIVYTPIAELYHRESATRGSLHPPEDEALLRDRWGDREALRDPFVNANVLSYEPLRLRD